DGLSRRGVPPVRHPDAAVVGGLHGPRGANQREPVQDAAPLPAARSCLAGDDAPRRGGPSLLESGRAGTASDVRPKRQLRPALRPLPAQRRQRSTTEGHQPLAGSLTTVRPVANLSDALGLVDVLQIPAALAFAQADDTVLDVLETHDRGRINRLELAVRQETPQPLDR